MCSAWRHLPLVTNMIWRYWLPVAFMLTFDTSTICVLTCRFLASNLCHRWCNMTLLSGDKYHLCLRCTVLYSGVSIVHLVAWTYYRQFKCDVLSGNMCWSWFICGFLIWRHILLILFKLQPVSLYNNVVKL